MAFLWVAAALIALYLIGGYVMFNVACVRRKTKPGTENPNSTWYIYRDRINEGIQWFKAQKTEDATIKSRDGLKLRAHYLRNGQSKNTIILAHGYRSTRFIDFACAFKYYYDLGFNLLSVDMRAHGDSEGRYILFGLAERYDIADWARFVDDTYKPDNIILDGMSMGAATVLMCADLDLPKSVSGIIADSGYTSPVDIWAKVLSGSTHIPSQVLMPVMRLMVKLFTGYSSDASSSVKSLKNAKVPVLIVHGKADDFVPCNMSSINYAACTSPKMLVTVPGACHGCSFLIDREKCSEALEDFFKRTLK